MDLDGVRLGVWLALIGIGGCTTAAPQVPGSETDGGADATPFRCPANSPTVLKGTVMFPNGELPVAGALVYLSPSGEPATRSGSCGQCVQAGSLGTSTRTEVDGSFELRGSGIRAGSQTVIVEKGGFRRTAQVQARACTSSEIDPTTTRLPRTSDEGVVPKMAVITGQYDHLDTVLYRLGFGPSAVETFSGDGPGFDSMDRLLSDPALLQTYEHLVR